jgi:ActD protein
MALYSDLYGVTAEFDNPDDLLAATERAYAEGYRKIEAYTPFPVHGLAEALGHRGIRLPWIVLAGGIVGAVSGFGLQFFTAVVSYPHNIGGRPLNSWPAFVPITFELTILCAALAAVFGMLALNGLPEPYHPLFNVPSFELASRSHFFLCIEASDPKFELEATRAFLEGLKPHSVSIVEP